MNKSQLEEVKANVLSLIQSQTNSFYTILELQKDYKEVIGHAIPLLGHRSVEHFLRDIPDVVKVNGSGPQAYLEYIPTSKSKHIGEMIKFQKQNTGKRRGKRTRPRNFNNNHEVQFPVYSDESDWDSRTMNKTEVQEAEKEANKQINLKANIDNVAPATTMHACSERTVVDEQQKKFRNPRSEFLYFMRKKYQERENTSMQSSSSTQSSESTVDSNGSPTNTTDHRGYKYILNKIRQNEAEFKEDSGPNKNVDQFKMSGTRFMQLTRRAKPQMASIGRCNENDEDEAVPAHAVTDIIERMNSAQISLAPSGPALSEISIPHLNLEEKFKVGEILSLFVVEIENPLQFFFHLYEEVDAFQCFQDEMQNVYSTLARGELCMSEHILHSGMVCAACLNDIWHRARVCSVPKDPNEFTKIKLFLVDRGLYCELTIRNLKFLARRFSYVPEHAICARLANIRTRSLSRDSQASVYFKELVQEKHLYGYVKSIESKKQQVELILLDTNVQPKRRIHEELIKAGLVEKA